MTRKIFLSYTGDVNDKLVKNIKLFFKALYIRVYDYKDKTRDHGVTKDVIEEELVSSTDVFFLISDQAMKSELVDFELALAIGNKKDIYVIKPRLIDKDRLPESIRNRYIYIEYDSPDDIINELSFARAWGINVYIPGGGFSGSSIEFSHDIPKLLYPIGDRPMLFHVIDSMDCGLFNKIILINKDDDNFVPDFIEYIINLGVKSKSLPLDVECTRTIETNWPMALKKLRPNNTFMLQLCDIILWTQGNGIGRDNHRKKLQDLINFHNYKRESNPKDYLGTLIVSDVYIIPAGSIQPGEGNSITYVRENPPLRGLIKGYINTGAAVLEPEILTDEFVDPSDTSILGGAVSRALVAKKKFGKYDWEDWKHVLNPSNWKNLHKEHLQRLRPRTGIV